MYKEKQMDNFPINSVWRLNRSQVVGGYWTDAGTVVTVRAGVTESPHRVRVFVGTPGRNRFGWVETADLIPNS